MPPEASVFSSICKAGVLVAPNSQRSRESEGKCEASNLLMVLTPRRAPENPGWGTWGGVHAWPQPEAPGQVQGRAAEPGASWLRWGNGRGLPSVVKARDRSPFSGSPTSLGPSSIQGPGTSLRRQPGAHRSRQEGDLPVSPGGQPGAWHRGVPRQKQSEPPWDGLYVQKKQ